jgi:hypothetical protein
VGTEDEWTRERRSQEKTEKKNTIEYFFKTHETLQQNNDFKDIFSLC